MQNQGQASRILSLKNIWIPIFVGLTVSLFLAHKKLDKDIFSSYNWDSINYKPFFLSIIFIICRDLIFSWRLRILTDGQLRFSRYLGIVVLWDFASAVTPSVIGGSVVSIFLLTKEGVKLGRAIASIIVTTIFDNLFFITISPLGYWVAYTKSYSNPISEEGIGGGLKFLFAIGVSIVFLYTSIVCISMWYNPRFFKWLMLKICTKIKFLKKWRYTALKNGNDIIISSEEFKNKSIKYWIKIFIYTAVAASCKYGVLNCIIACIKDLNFQQHLYIIGNQILLWKVMLLSPTPGSTGTAEMFFSILFSELLKESLIFVQLIWRFMTYYLQIIVGAIVISSFLKKDNTVKTL